MADYIVQAAYTYYSLTPTEIKLSPTTFALLNRFHVQNLGHAGDYWFDNYTIHNILSVKKKKACSLAQATCFNECEIVFHLFGNDSQKTLF